MLHRVAQRSTELHRDIKENVRYNDLKVSQFSFLNGSKWKVSVIRQDNLSVLIPGLLAGYIEPFGQRF